jgi:Pentatricopeptide repeat domain
MSNDGKLPRWARWNDATRPAAIRVLRERRRKVRRQLTASTASGLKRRLTELFARIPNPTQKSITDKQVNKAIDMAVQAARVQGVVTLRSYVAVAQAAEVLAVADARIPDALLRHMRINSIRPNIRVLESIVHLFFRCARIEEAMRIISTLPSLQLEPSQTMMLDAIEWFVRHDDPEGMVSHLLQLRDLGMEMGRKSFTIAISAFALAGHMVSATSLVTTLQEKAHLVPDAGVYTALIQGFAMIPDGIGAEAVIEDMQAAGIDDLPVEVLTAWLRAYVRAGDYTNALRVYDTHSDDADQQMCLLMMQGCLDAEDFSKMQFVFRQARNVARNSVSPLLYAYMLEMLGRRGDYTDAVRLIDAMQGVDQIDPTSPVVYQHLVRGLCKHAKEEHFSHVYQILTEEMPARSALPDQQTVSMALSFVQDSSHFDEIWNLYVAVPFAFNPDVVESDSVGSAKKFTPTNGMFCALATRVCNANQHDRVLQVLQLMRQNGIHPTLATYEHLLRQLDPKQHAWIISEIVDIMEALQRKLDYELDIDPHVCDIVVTAQKNLASTH